MASGSAGSLGKVGSGTATVLAMSLNQPSVRTAADEEQERTVGLIEQLPLFSKLPSVDQRRVAAMTKVVPFAKGDFVFRRGAEGDSFVTIVSGCVHVVLPNGLRISRSEGGK